MTDSDPENTADSQPPEHNPYAGPETTAREFAQAPRRKRKKFRLADRGTRLGAVVIEGLLVAVCYVPLFATLAVSETFEFTVFVGLSLLLLSVYGLLTLYFVATRAQTLGKLMLGISIATPDGERAGFARIFLLRGLVAGLPVAVPYLGSLYGLVDILFIFGQERRCLHDLIAGTIVIEARG